MKMTMKRLFGIFLACTLLLSSCFVTGLAEKAAGEDVSVSDNAGGDIKEGDPESKDTPEQPMSAEEAKKAATLVGKVQELKATSTTFTLNGKTYHDIYNGNSQEALKTVPAKELFKKVLTSDLTGYNVFKTWIPAARAALLSGGYNNFYYVDDYWTPSTFKDAFEDWSSTWCTKKSTPSSFKASSFSNSDIQYAQDFTFVGEYMRQSIKDNSDYVYKGLKGNNDAYNDILKNWKAPDYTGDIFFIPFTEVIHRGSSGDKSSGHLGYAWDSFAICFYDFKLNPLTNLLKTGEDGSPNEYYQYTAGDDKTVSLSQNDSAEDRTFTSSKSNTETVTVSNTLSVSKTISFTEGASISYTHGFGAKPFANEVTLNASFSATQSQTSSESNTTGTSKEHTDTWSLSGTLKPATQVTVTQSSGLSEGAISYTCPVEYRYKVAIVSLCGEYEGALPYRKVKVRHAGTCRIFGESNGDALSDLTYRYNNKSYDGFHLVWDSGSSYTPLLGNDLWCSSVGGTNTFVVKETMSSSSALTPLHPLNRTEVTNPDKTTYTIRLSKDQPDKNRLNLASLEVSGLSILPDQVKTKVPYYGFAADKGQWKMIDDNGNVIESNEYAEIQKTKTGTYLVAKKAGDKPINLKYFINDNTYPAFPGNVEKKDVFLKNSDLSANAVVDVYIYEGVAPNNDSLSVPVTKQEKINAQYAIDSGFRVLTSDGKINVEWGAVKNADRYEVFAGSSSGGSVKLIKTLKGSDKNTYSIEKIDGAKIDDTDTYKVYVIAYRTVNGKKTKLAKSMVANVAGAKNEQYTNATKIKGLNTSLSLKVGKSKKLKAKVSLQDKNKKQLFGTTYPFSYISTSNKIATVNENGVITAKAEGSCIIYVSTSNGCTVMINVNVK